MTQRSFDNRVALVTGASRGIGHAIALRLAKLGANVVVNHLEQSTQAGAVVAELIELGTDALEIEADVSDRASVERMIETINSHYGRLDFLVNNAGIYPRMPWRDLTDQIWDRVMAVNVRGSFLCARTAYELLSKSDMGRIVILGSTSLISAPINLMAYTTSKSALLGLTRSLAREFGDVGATVNMVASGTTMTEGIQEWMDQGLVDLDSLVASRASQPIKRLGEPDDLAGVVAFLCGPDAGFITGQFVNVDGGRQFY